MEAAYYFSKGSELSQYPYLLLDFPLNSFHPYFNLLAHLVSDKKMKGVNIKFTNHEEETVNQLSLWPEQPIDKFLKMSHIVMKIDKECKIIRDSKDKIKYLKSELHQLAKTAPT